MFQKSSVGTLKFLIFGHILVVQTPNFFELFEFLGLQSPKNRQKSTFSKFLPHVFETSHMDTLCQISVFQVA